MLQNHTTGQIKKIHHYIRKDYLYVRVRDIDRETDTDIVKQIELKSGTSISGKGMG